MGLCNRFKLPHLPLATQFPSMMVELSRIGGKKLVSDETKVSSASLPCFLLQMHEIKCDNFFKSDLNEL